MITIEVRLYATLQKYHPSLGIGEPLTITLNDKTKLGNLFNELKIPKEEIKAVFMNGKWEEESYLLEDGDRIGIFSPIGLLQPAPSDEAKQGAFEAILPSKPAYVPA